MFKTHNSISVRYDGQEFTRPNEVIDVKTYLMQDLPYAAFIIANGKVEKAGLESLNSDITKGILYAEYSAVFDKNEYDGEEFSQFGLSADGELLVNSASFEPIIKSSGKAVKVSVTVFLEIEDGSKNLICGGKNPLCEFLLGARSLGRDVGFVSGRCNIQNSNIIRTIDTALITEAELILDEGRISFCATAGKDVPEIIFTVDKIPVLRVYVYAQSPKVVSGASVVKDDYTVNLGYADVSALGSMMINFANVAGGSVLSTFDEIIETAHLFGFNFGQNTKIKSDIFKRYAAVLNDKEAYFFESANNSIKLLYRLELEKDLRGFDVCEGGYLALYYDKVRLYDKNKIAESGFSVECGDENIMFSEGSHFFYATRVKGEKLKTYKITLQSCTKIAELDIVGGSIFKNFFSLAVLDKSANSYFVNSGTLTAAANASLSTLCYGADETIFAGGLICTRKSGVYTVTAEDFLSVKALPADVSVKAFGEYIITEDSNANQSIMYFDRAKRTIVQVFGCYSAGIDKISAIASIGDYFLIADGDSKIKTFYKNKSGSFAYYGGYTKGAQAIYVVQINDSESFSGEQIKTSIFIDIK